MPTKARRKWVKQKAQISFRENKNLTDPESVEFQLRLAQTHLDSLITQSSHLQKWMEDEPRGKGERLPDMEKYQEEVKDSIEEEERQQKETRRLKNQEISKKLDLMDAQLEEKADIYKDIMYNFEEKSKEKLSSVGDDKMSFVGGDKKEKVDLTGENESEKVSFIGGNINSNEKLETAVENNQEKMVENSQEKMVENSQEKVNFVVENTLENNTKSSPKIPLLDLNLEKINSLFEVTPENPQVDVNEKKKKKSAFACL